MVRGRRVRNFVASTKGADFDSPKRKDQKLDFTGKLSHTIVPPSSIVKSQTITDFFHVVDDNDTELQNLINTCPVLLRNELNSNHDKNSQITKSSTESVSMTEVLVTNDAPAVMATMATTPHRIELCTETQNSPTSQLSQLHIAALASKKGAPPKARRKLNTNPNSAQVLRATSKDDTLNKNNATATVTVTNHTLTEYFPVRRSVRKTKRTVLEEKQRTLEQCVRNEIEEGLEIHNFSGKGRGVVASQSFCKGDFVVEYRGQLIDMAEAKRRELKYAQDQNTGCYMYYFKHKNLQYCVDATSESSYLGRLVNHSRNGNLVTRTVSVDGIPRLVLIAKEDIMRGEEVTYDYGDRSKESLKYHPWLAT